MLIKSDPVINNINKVNNRKKKKHNLSPNALSLLKTNFSDMNEVDLSDDEYYDDNDVPL